MNDSQRKGVDETEKAARLHCKLRSRHFMGKSSSIYALDYESEALQNITSLKELPRRVDVNFFPLNSRDGLRRKENLSHWCRIGKLHYQVI